MDKLKEIRDYLIRHSECYDCFHCMYQFRYKDQCKECNRNTRDRFIPDEVVDEIFTLRAKDIMGIMSDK